MSNFVIGIEGLVGTGKTTICREMLNYIPNAIFLNGSNLYRAIVYVMMQEISNIEELKNKAKNIDIRDIMQKLGIEIKFENRETVFYYKNQKIEEEKLQSQKASMAVSNIGGIADNENLFIFARELINSIKENSTVIISGRGITKIYPDVDYHFFLVADLEERVKRKSIQYEEENKEELKENIKKRDELQKLAGFYDKSDKTIEIDVTDCKTPEESINRILKYIQD